MFPNIILEHFSIKLYEELMETSNKNKITKIPMNIIFHF